MKFTLRGIYVATVTPFTASGAVDEDAYSALVDHYVEAGVAGLVPIGTTGESVTLSSEERLRVVELTRKAAPASMPIIAGAGTNATASTIEAVREVAQAGADGALVVCPYYNKPTQEGLLAHFEAVAEASPIPLVIYNIPGRTGRNIEVATMIRLAQHPKIIGVKDASTMQQILETIRLAPDTFAVLTGEDPLIFLTICAGGRGAISAAAGVATADWVRLVRHAEAGELDEARRIFYRLLPIVDALFAETNPSPVKTALTLQSLLPRDDVRLPLVRTSAGLRDKLRKLLEEAGYLG